MIETIQTHKTITVLTPASCDHQCSYCTFPEFYKSHVTGQPTDWVKMFNVLENMTPDDHFVLSGGEPLNNSLFLAAIFAMGSFKTNHLFLNTSLPWSKEELLKEVLDAIPLTGLSVSDHGRLHGSTIDYLRQLKELYPACNIRINRVITSNDFSELNDLYRFSCTDLELNIRQDYNAEPKIAELPSLVKRRLMKEDNYELVEHLIYTDHCQQWLFWKPHSRVRYTTGHAMTYPSAEISKERILLPNGKLFSDWKWTPCDKL